MHWAALGLAKHGCIGCSVPLGCVYEVVGGGGGAGRQRPRPSHNLRLLPQVFMGDIGEDVRSGQEKLKNKCLEALQLLDTRKNSKVGVGCV